MELGESGNKDSCFRFSYGYGSSEGRKRRRCAHRGSNIRKDELVELLLDLGNR